MVQKTSSQWLKKVSFCLNTVSLTEVDTTVFVVCSLENGTTKVANHF